MDPGIIFTILGGFFAMIATMFALFLWNRSEANADRKEGRALIDAHRVETQVLVSAIQADVKAVQQEMKEFHAKLIEIGASKRTN